MKVPEEFEDTGYHDMFISLINSSDLIIRATLTPESKSEEIEFNGYQSFKSFSADNKLFFERGKKDIITIINHKPSKFEKLVFISSKLNEAKQALNRLTQSDGKYKHEGFRFMNLMEQEAEAKTLTENDIQEYYQLMHKSGSEFINYLTTIQASIQNSSDGDFSSPDPLSGSPPRSSKNDPLAFFEFYFVLAGISDLYELIVIEPYEPDQQITNENDQSQEISDSSHDTSPDLFDEPFEKILQARINEEFYKTLKYIDERVDRSANEAEITLFLKKLLFRIKFINNNLHRDLDEDEKEICGNALKAIIRYIFKKHEPFTQEFRTESFFSKIVGVTQQLPMIEKPERLDNFESKADDYSIINLTPRITQEIPKKIVEMYYKQYNPEDYIVVDLTSNFERKHSEEIKRTAPEPPRLFYDIYGLVEDDNMIGLMMMPMPAKLSISQTQLTLFNNLLTDKGFEHIDFSKRTFQTISFEYFNYDYIPEVLHKGVMPFLYYYRKGFFTGYKLLRANKQEENSKRNLRYINEVTSPPPISDFKDSAIYVYWRDMGLKQGRLYSIWQTILENPDEFAGLIKNEKIRQEQPSDRRTISATRKIIEDSFDEMGSKGQKGWQYAFRTENDFKKFVSLLEKYFMLESYELPEETLLTRPKTKTQIAQAIHRIYKELGEELKSDTEFFKIIRYLKVFNESEDAEIYKSITRSSGF
ncbi:MAG: hypothetical protein IH597_02895 [Bacteroidales bacterium]|nr:hypothetical protein [Bacteroidales bacterium]